MHTRYLHVDRFLEPGELIASATPLAVKTILGSCIAVCLWDPVAKIGGVNHYLLPHPCRPQDSGNRFGVMAIPALLQEIAGLGGAPGRLVASVIGGGCPMGALHTAFVGRQNRDIAIETLERLHVRIRREDTGGHHGRKLLFNTGSGQLIVRRVRGMHERLALEG